MMSRAKIRSINSLLVCLILFSNCSSDHNNTISKSKRDCSCPMSELADLSTTKEQDSTSLETDFYDWSMNGKIGGTIRKIIDAEIITNNRSSKSKYEISTKEVIKEIRTDYPELIKENYQFKLKRLAFCTYHDLICNDTIQSDSIYRALMIIKLSEFESEIDQVLEEKEEVSRNDLISLTKPPSKTIDNRNIKANIYTENQSGGVNTVNIISSEEYKELSSEISHKIRGNLSSIKRKYNIGNNNWINIKVEAGSSIRRKVAIDLDSLLSFKENDWAFFGRNNTNIGNYPNFPISIFYNPEIENIVKDLLTTLDMYITDGFELRSDTNHQVDLVTIYINGTPNFNERGQVRIE